MYTTADGPAYHWRTTASWAFLSSVTAFPLAPGYCWGTPAESREWEGRGERGLEHVQRQEIRENTCTREHIHTHTHTHTHTHARTHTHHNQRSQRAGSRFPCQRVRVGTGGLGQQTRTPLAASNTPSITSQTSPPCSVAMVLH